jgi:hypothetical protein
MKLEFARDFTSEESGNRRSECASRRVLVTVLDQTSRFPTGSRSEVKVLTSPFSGTLATATHGTCDAERKEKNTEP